MTISMVQRLPIGNALRVFMQPPAGASYWRLLRKDADTFSGPTDPQAIVVHEGNEKAPLDDRVLNGIDYHYRAYYRVGAAWQASATVTGRAAFDLGDGSADVVEVLRDRLGYGLANEVAAGRLVHETGKVPIFTAPPSTDSARWPVVTLHLDAHDPNQRFLGEQFGMDQFDEGSGQWLQDEGWLARVSVQVIGWAMNPDARIALRKSLQRIVIANLPVFDSHGFVNVEFNVRDSEDFESFNAPVYQVMGTFTCLAPTAVTSTAGVIADVTQQQTN